jgi:predicted enzyme related to lactoylglutathione lyase
MQKAVAAGAKVYRAAFDVGDAQRVGFVFDPEGRQLEFVSEPGQRA